jgi:hypothetical protein
MVSPKLRKGPVVLGSSDLLHFGTATDTPISLTFTSEKLIESFTNGLDYQEKSKVTGNGRLPSEEVEQEYYNGKAD